MEESVLLHRLESRVSAQKTQAIDELIGIVQDSGKLHFNNKLSLFSSFKRLLHDEDLQLRTKCTKLISEVLPKLFADMDTCMGFVIPSILNNLSANNLVLKRESIKLVRCFSEITPDKNSLIRSIIWEGIDNKNPAVAREVIVSLDKLILNVIKTEDCYNIVAALCKRHYLEDNKKLNKAIRESFNSITAIITLPKMEELISQLPTSAVTSGRELLNTFKNTEKPKPVSYKSSSKLEVDSAISLESSKLYWDLIPETTLDKLHGPDLAEQLKAIAELEVAIRKVTNPSEFLICIDEICENIIKVIPINNFRVFKSSTVLVSTFVEVFREVLGENVIPLIRALCHKIGDNKIAVREGSMKCLTQIMKACGPRPVVEVVLANMRDRNPKVREQAINVLIKSLLSFPIENLNIPKIAEHLADALTDPRPRVSNTALEAIAAFLERLPAREVTMLYRAVERVDTPDRRFVSVIKDRVAQGNTTTVNEVGLVTHGEGCFSRAGTTLTGTSSRMSIQSISVPTTSQERILTKDGTMCPPTPMGLPRRYYSAGRNRLPWERPERQDTAYFNKGTEDQFGSPRPGGGAGPGSNVFIKGGGARTDGGSYAQMHLKKIQQDQQDHGNNNINGQGRNNTLCSLKKYFPSVKGSPDPKRSWPIVTHKDAEVNSNGSVPPSKSNSFANDSYGVHTSSMYANFRVNSGESSGVGTLTSNTPNGAQPPPRHNHVSPVNALNDSGIFEEHSFVNSKRSTPVTDEAGTTPQGPEEQEGEEQGPAEEERLELAKWEKIRAEELAKEEKRRSHLRAQLMRENEVAETQYHEGVRIEYSHNTRGYAELTSQNLAKKKLRAAAEDSRKPRAKVLKARTRTESMSNDKPDIDIVGRGLSSNHADVDSSEIVKEQPKDRKRIEKEPLRAPSGVYGQRVHRAAHSPDDVDGSLSDTSDNSEDDSLEDHREGHPVGSGLSAATRMRFEKKRAECVERQSAEQVRPPPREEYTVEEGHREVTSQLRKKFGKPVSAPVESRLNNSDPGVKRSTRASSHRPHDKSESQEPQNTSLQDDKEEVPLMNPEFSANEAIKSLKMGGEEWSFKLAGLHVLRRLARHHPALFTAELLLYLRATCVEVLNLRSQVSRLAIQIVGDYFSWHKTAMDADIDRTCECLLTKTGDMNQFIRNDILATLGMMVDNLTPLRVLAALINHGTYHKNGNVRSISALCFKDVVTRIGVSRCLANKDIAPKFIAALNKLSHDGNQETRYYGRLVVSWCMETGNFETTYQRHLPARDARSMKDLCEKLAAKGVGSQPSSSDRTSGRYRSQPVSRAQSNLSATYPANRARKPSSREDRDPSPDYSSPRVTRRPGPRRDLRDSRHADKMPQSLYKNLNSSNWQDRYNGIAELLDLTIKLPGDVRLSIVRIGDAFTPRLKDPNSKVNLYALQCLLRMLPYWDTALDNILTPLTELLVPNLASTRANIVSLTSQILDGFRGHVDNVQLLCEYCRIARGLSNPRIKPIILDKISDMISGVYDTKPKLVEQITLPIIIEHCECLPHNSNTGVNSLGSYVGRLTSLLHKSMGSRLLSEISRIKPGSLLTIREYLLSTT